MVALKKVLAELEQLSMIQKRETDSSNEASISMEGPNYEQLIEWLEDPITGELMCDPVKAVDGHTYDRWTIVRSAASGNSNYKSPFSPGQSFAIATDDIDVRSRLFARFPEQEVKFHAERAAYRDEALEEANNEHLGDAVRMLGHVLEWAPDDKECRERRDQALLQMEVGESILKAGQVLEAGAWLRKGNYKLVMQKDDNLVIYCDGDENGAMTTAYATWSTKTYLKAGGKGECRLRMQSDGNLQVMYNSGVVGADQREVVLWESNTATSSSNGEYALHLKETGILEIRSSSSGARQWCSEPMSKLMAGETLKAGSFLVKGAYRLAMQRDDNLVLYDLGNGQALWSSRTMGVAGGTGGCSLVMQRDCNLVIFDGAGHAVWMSNSRDPVHTDYSLHLRSDGVLIIRSPEGHIKRWLYV